MVALLKPYGAQECYRDGAHKSVSCTLAYSTWLSLLVRGVLMEGCVDEAFLIGRDTLSYRKASIVSL